MGSIGLLWGIPARRLDQAGLVVATLGALALAWGGVLTRSRVMNRSRRGVALIAAGILLGLGFLLQLMALPSI